MKLKLKEEAMFFSFVECDAFCVFSMKTNGNMKGEEGRGNREVFFEKYLPKSVKKIIMAEQIHGNSVEVVGMNSPDLVMGVDSLVTCEKGIALGTFADCRNVLLCDQGAGVIGNAHLGYRGILQKCAHNTVSKMIGLGAKKERIELIIGQGACKKCYEFDKKDSGIFSRRYESFICGGENGSSKVFIDLFGMIFSQLTNEIGIPSVNIRYINACTCEDSNFFSQRRDKCDPVEAGIAVIGLR